MPIISFAVSGGGQRCADSVVITAHSSLIFVSDSPGPCWSAAGSWLPSTAETKPPLPLNLEVCFRSRSTCQYLHKAQVSSQLV